MEAKRQDIGMDIDENKKEETQKSTSAVREILSWVLTFALAIGAAFLIKNYLIINADVPTGSMENTIMPGDRLIGNRLAFLKDTPERGDVVIFHYPDDEEELYVKRVIGLPGEVVEIKDGKVYIDGSPTPLDDSFIPEKMVGSYGPYTVPENCYFMLGDNRNDSKDSRSWKNKFVRFDQLVGKAVVRYYPSFKWLR